MGYTGIYDWSIGEKNVDILKRELKSPALKWAERGGHVWCLYECGKGTVWASVFLCKRESKCHTFWYKEISIADGPFYYDMPKSWISLLSEECKEKAKDWIKIYKECKEKAKKSLSVNFRDIVQCRSNRSIEWGWDGFSIKKNEDFFVLCDYHTTPRGKRKEFIIARQSEFTGKWYRTPYHLRGTTFKNFEILKKVAEFDVTAF